MRLWTLHPKYLDAKGLVALWREGLLARSVLRGETRGYRNHPQLIRFQKAPDPIRAIDAFLLAVLMEARARNYRFDGRKVKKTRLGHRISVQRGQIAFELRHLRKKLLRRDPARARKLPSLSHVEINNVFQEVAGGIEPWERLPPVPPTPDSKAKKRRNKL